MLLSNVNPVKHELHMFVSEQIRHLLTEQFKHLLDIGEKDRPIVQIEQSFMLLQLRQFERHEKH